MNMKLCSRCKKNPAVIYISKIEGDKTTQEGLCIKCALEMNIGPIKDMLSKMGITEDDIDSLNEQFGNAFLGSDENESFENGGAPTLPFLQGLFGDQSAPNKEKNKEGILYKGVIATHLIGPLLVRNPALLKYIVKKIVFQIEPNFSYKDIEYIEEEKGYSVVLRELKKRMGKS